MAKGKEWAGTTYGNGCMHRWLIRSLRLLDVRLLYAFTSVFIIPVCLLINKSRTYAYRYFRDHQGYGRWKAAWNVYVNHCMFAQVVLDRFAMYAGKKFNLEIEGYEDFLLLANKPEGFIQLSAHIGNYEMAGYSLVAKTKVFNALVYGGEKDSVIQNRSNMFSKTNIRMIPIRMDMSHIFDVNNALAEGQIVSIPADRLFGSEKYVEHDFLGGKAHFPMGPYSIATMRSLDVLAVNVMKISSKTYKIYVTKLDYDKRLTRKAQINNLADLFVSELERIVKKHPTQWYNYYSFWRS